MNGNERWDERYRAGEHAAAEPDPFLDELRRYRGLLRSANPTAIDIACGAGRHAIALASLGFDVVAADYSEEALKLTGDRASTQGVKVTPLLIDLESADLDLGESRFDVVAAFYFLHRPLIAPLKSALRPGGLIVYRTFLAAAGINDRGPKNPAYRLQPGELLELFRGFRVLRYQEECVTQDSDGPATAALVAQKPCS